MAFPIQRANIADGQAIAAVHLTDVYDVLGNNPKGSSADLTVRLAGHDATLAGLSATYLHDTSVSASPAPFLTAVYGGNATVTISASPRHNLLTGLSGDDHPQYLNQARAASGFLQISNQLRELSAAPSAAAARNSLGLGAAATSGVGPGGVMDYNDNRIAGAMQKSANLADVASVPAARTVLGLGTAALVNAAATPASAGVAEVVLGADGRLTNSRTPLAHLHPYTDISNWQAGLSSTIAVSGGNVSTSGSQVILQVPGGGGSGLPEVAVQPDDPGLGSQYTLWYDTDAASTVTPGSGIPTGGNTGQVLAKNSATAYDALWKSVGNLAIDIQTFTIVGSFTWTKPANAILTQVQMQGSGGGGGSGRRDVTGTLRAGGSGGNGGSYAEMMYDATQLPATVGVTVGGGGAGGAMNSGLTSSGITGATGGLTKFQGTGSGTPMFMYCPGGTGGAGGTNAGGTIAAATLGLYPGGSGAVANATGGQSSNAAASTIGCRATGGGGGGSITTGDVASNGSAGGFMALRNYQHTGGVVGASPTQDGQVVTVIAGEWFGYSGAGGGASNLSANAGTGGAGLNGSGGGGGGAGVNTGGNGGAGGKGGDGVVVITTFCLVP